MKLKLIFFMLSIEFVNTTRISINTLFAIDPLIEQYDPIEKEFLYMLLNLSDELICNKIKMFILKSSICDKNNCDRNTILFCNKLKNYINDNIGDLDVIFPRSSKKILWKDINTTIQEFKTIYDIFFQ